MQLKAFTYGSLLIKVFDLGKLDNISWCLVYYWGKNGDPGYTGF